MKNDNMNTAASALYDTPPHGDFVRYVDDLLAAQAGGVVLHQYTVAPGLVRKPQIAVAKTQPAGKPVASGAAQQAEALLDRIRQLEARRKAGAADAGKPEGSPAGANRPFTIDESKLSTPTAPNGLKLLGFAIMGVLGFIFPPLGIVMLIAVAKKWFNKHAKN